MVNPVDYEYLVEILSDINMKAVSQNIKMVEKHYLLLLVINVILNLHQFGIIWKQRQVKMDVLIVIRLKKLMKIKKK